MDNSITICTLISHWHLVLPTRSVTAALCFQQVMLPTGCGKTVVFAGEGLVPLCDACKALAETKQFFCCLTHSFATMFAARLYLQTVTQTFCRSSVPARTTCYARFPPNAASCMHSPAHAALARYMTQHYVPMAANTAASESAAGAAPETAGGPAGFGSMSAQHRGGPTIAAASTENTPTAEARQVDGEGSDAGNSTSYGTSYGGTSSEGSIVEGDSDEDALLSAAPSRLQRIQQALKGSSSSKSAQSLHDGSSTGSRAAGMQQDCRRADTVSTSGSGSSTSPSTPNTVSSTASSTPTSSNEEEGGSKRTPGKRRKARQQQPQQEQQPEVQRQVAPAGSMRVLVLAHRHELLHQAEEKFRLMWGAEDLTVSWVKGKRKEFEGQVSKPW